MVFYFHGTIFSQQIHYAKTQNTALYNIFFAVIFTGMFRHIRLLPFYFLGRFPDPDLGDYTDHRRTLR